MNISMAQAIANFPEYLEEARTLCQSFRIPKCDPDRIVVLGMGGSAIGGDLLAVVSEKNGLTPVHVIRDENVSFPVTDKTLVISVSYSGNTQETLSALESVLAKRKGTVFGIATGGKLKQMAQASKFPCFEIPGGLMPRAGLPFTFVPLLHILQHVCGTMKETDLSETIAVLKMMRAELGEPAQENEARKLANSLVAHLPVLYAPGPLFAPAARRWKAQLNENAKHPAYFDVFPEATHNEIVAYTRALPIHKSMAAVFLRDSDESPAQEKKIAFMKKLTQTAGAAVHEVRSRGNGFLARLLSLCMFADYTSLYLAEKKEVDPIQIAVIDQLKNELSEKPAPIASGDRGIKKL